jgi:hypothetical protein
LDRRGGTVQLAGERRQGQGSQRRSDPVHLQQSRGCSGESGQADDPAAKGCRAGGKPPHTRSEAVRRIAEVGRKVWKTETGYPKRSLSKTTMVRFQTIIGATLKPRSLANQKTEASVAVRCLNSVTALGMPVGIKIA